MQFTADQHLQSPRLDLRPLQSYLHMTAIIGARRGLPAATTLCLAVVVTSIDCGKDSAICTPGEQRSCQCAAGSSGVMTCNSDGRGYSLCSGCDQCPSLVRRYADLLPAALKCNPSLTNACSAQRPMLVWEDDGGARTLEGLTVCTHAVAIDGTTQLDGVLAEFRDAGCRFIPTPYWPPDQTTNPPTCVPFDTCTSTDAGWTCAP